MTLNAEGLFDRVVSIEMFEHMRNYEKLLGRVNRGLKKRVSFLFIYFLTKRLHILLKIRTMQTGWQESFLVGVKCHLIGC